MIEYRIDRKMIKTHVIDDVAVLLEVNWVDCLIIPVSFFTIQILRLSTMTRVYELNRVSSAACMRETASHNGRRGNH